MSIDLNNDWRSVFNSQFDTNQSKNAQARTADGQLPRFEDYLSGVTTAETRPAVIPHDPNGRKPGEALKPDQRGSQTKVADEPANVIIASVGEAPKDVGSWLESMASGQPEPADRMPVDMDGATAKPQLLVDPDRGQEMIYKLGGALDALNMESAQEEGRVSGVQSSDLFQLTGRGGARSADNPGAFLDLLKRLA